MRDKLPREIIEVTFRPKCWCKKCGRGFSNQDCVKDGLCYMCRGKKINEE